MTAQEYEHYYKIEDSYWWFVGMRDIFNRLIRNRYSGAESLRILDIGCGTGRTMKDLQGLGSVLGLDIEPKALSFCRTRGIKRLVRGSAHRLPFKNKSFDLITLFNVIEHVDGDLDFLKEVNKACKDNGRIILATSAFNFLWSAHDIVNKHKRRYTRRSLKVIVGKYFSVEKITYTNCILFPIIWIGIFLNNLLKGRSHELSDGFYQLPKFVNKFLIFILEIESILLERFNFPFGVSLLCMAKNQKNS